MPKSGFSLLQPAGWTFPSKIFVCERWVDRDAVNPSVSRYETRIGKLRVAFSVVYQPAPLGKRMKSPRPIWTAGVFSTESPAFSFSTGTHSTYQDCDTELRSHIKRARARLLKCL